MSGNPIWHEAQGHLAACDPVLCNLIDRHGSCSIGPNQDYFAILCESIISQQLAARAAAAIAGRFSEYYGGEVTPDRVAETAMETLRSLGLSNRKATYILDLAEKVLAGTITPKEFPALPDEAIIRQLVAVKGIGVWTVQMFLIFSLNRPDVLPTDDYGIRKALMLFYGLENLPDKTTMEKLAEPWRPWRSVACWYLWRGLANP